MIIGRKKNISPGYIWIPYIMTQSVSTISESDFKPRKLSSGYVQTVASRYGTIVLTSKKRVEKAKKILKKIEDFKNQK
jgi:formylmethanofuran dehydrogenase subunit D